MPSVSKNFAGSPTAPEEGSLVALRARRFFLLNAGLGGVVALAAAASVGAAAASVRVAPGTHATRLTIAGLHLSHPSINAAAAVLLAMAVIGAVALSRGLWAAFAEFARDRRLRRGMMAHTIRIEGDLVIVQEPTVQAFCAGLLRPRVYVSTGAVDALGTAELKAVLAHERHHLVRRDPLRIAVGRVFARALFFVPTVGLLHRRYCAMAELAADDAAIAAQPGGSRALASALLGFADASKPAGAVGIAPERVDHILGRAPDWKLPAGPVAVAVAIAALIGALAWQLAQVASAQTSLSLPLLSAQPCIVVLALLPAGLSALAVAHMRRAV